MQIFVENLTFVGRHGVYEEERRDGRRFRVDLCVDTERASVDDDVSSTIDYRELANTILEHGQGPSVELIETLAERIVDTLYQRFSAVHAVDLSIRKYATGVPGDPQWVGIRVRSTRDSRQEA